MKLNPWMKAPPEHDREKRIGHVKYCNWCHAFVPFSELTNHESFHENYTNRKDGSMSNVLWCDPGNHAFKANEPGSVHYQGTAYEKDGSRHEADVDACSQHNPFGAHPENTVKEIDAGYAPNE